MDQWAAYFGGTALFIDMRFIFMTEMFERAEHRVGRTLTKSAQAVARDFITQVFKLLDVAVFALAIANFLQQFQNAACANAAGCAFSAGFSLCEIHEEAGDVYHA